MKTKRTLTVAICAVGTLLLIVDAKTALNSAADAIGLCTAVVVPSLFPFFVLSVVMNNVLSGAKIPLLRPISSLCRIPQGAESILLLGLIGGYPVGAAGIAQAYQSGALSKKDSERMLSFCNNAGPAFIFGLLSPVLGRVELCWALWIIHILSAIAVGTAMPGGSKETASAHCVKTLTVAQAMQMAVRNMATVCGWVIMFRVMLGFISHWFLWLASPVLRSIIAGIFELSNGCLSLIQIENTSLRFLCASGFLSFGGICVSMQTASVTGGLSLRKYYIGKTLQTILSLLLGVIFLSL
ncbi:MAG: hypothetical protein E7461_00715 [Ruminococcaceae bacterium]|nr:hypothetical protein [Oscillospiraceae bacterium]